jgi:hypothetical protein
MKKFYFISLLICAVVLSSCKLTVIPRAVNTVNAVSLEELNLERKDYKILNTISAEATVIYKQISGSSISVQEKNGEFKFLYKLHKVPFKGGEWELESFSGVARLGYLDNDYANYDKYSAKEIQPEFMARAIAIYRLINACKVAGGDGLIEPIISTNVEQSGTRSISYKTTVSAKIIKLNTDGK